MKLLKPVFLLALLFPGGCGDDCGADVPDYINVIGLTGTNVQLRGDNYRNYDSLTAGERISYEYHALQVTPTVELTNQRTEVLIRGWMSAAYACDPVLPEPFERITDIVVFSNAAYQQASSSKVIAAGERLNNITKIYDRRSGRITGLPDFLLDEPFASGNGIFLQLTSAPAQETTHTFTVRYALDNGETYEFTAPPVTLTP